jgi:hypothetical protein
MKYVALLRPLDDFKDYTRNISRRYGKYIAKYPALDHHCTLMAVRAQESTEEQLVKDLETVTQEQFPAELTGELDLFDGMALVARVKKSPWLRNLHKQVIDRMKNYVDWAETGRLPDQYAANPERARIFRTYGSAYCAELYNPHVSIAELKPEILKDEHLIQNKKLVMNSILSYGWQAMEFELVKKQDGDWRLVRRFQLK